MSVFFAPLEGITGYIYRNAHHRIFPGVAAYYTPFLTPTSDSPLTGKGLTDVLPQNNQKIPLIPQLLTNRAEDFLAAAASLRDLGYEEVNLNLGCPSGTVFAKRKGAGFLSLPQELDAFLDTVFSGTTMKISIKTRLGVTDPDEWPALLSIFNRYPVSRLIVHPRVRQDFYKNPVRPAAFQYAIQHSPLPLCYNGDLYTVNNCQDLLTAFPTVSDLMLGRGLIRNPALVRELNGGTPLTQAELAAFHDTLLDAYCSVLYGERPVLGKMKELWFYMHTLFEDAEKPYKAIRKAKTLRDYKDAVQLLFQNHAFRK